MIKRQFVLTEQQYEWMKSEADRLEISINELLRRAIDAFRGEIPVIRKVSKGANTETVEE